MALIKCPECGKELSEKAKTCPNCGFPISDYLEEEKKKQESIEKLKEKQLTLSKFAKKHNFIFFGKSIALSFNDVLASKIKFSIIECSNRTDGIFQDTYSSIPPSDFFEEDLKLLSEEIYTKVLEECSKFMNSIQRDVYNFIGSNNSDIDFSISTTKPDEFYEEVKNEFYGLRKEALKDEKKLDQNEERIINTYQNGNFIDSVRSNTVAGLVGASIKANIVNGISNSISHSTMRKELSTLSNKRSEFQSDFDYELFSIFYDISSDLISTTFAALVQKYEELGILNNYVKTTEKENNLEELHNYVSNPYNLQSDKVNLLYNAILIEPSNYQLYMMCVEFLVFNNAQKNNFLKLADFTRVKHEIEYCISKGDSISYSMDFSGCNLLQIDNLYFPSLSEKEKYLSDKHQFSDKINTFFSERKWFDIGIVSSDYNEITNSGKPQSYYYKDKLNTIDEMYKNLNDFHTEFIDFLFPALCIIQSNYSVLQLFELLNNHKFELEKNEVPIAYYKYGTLTKDNSYDSSRNSHGLLITNYRMALTYTDNNQIFYSFFPTKEYISDFVPSDNALLFRSPSAIHFVNDVIYKDKYSYNSYGNIFYTNVGKLERNSSSSDFDNFTTLYITLKEKYIDKSYHPSYNPFQLEDINLIPYTIVLDTLSEYDTQSENFKKWYSNNEKGIQKFSNFRLIDTNKSMSTNNKDNITSSNEKFDEDLSLASNSNQQDISNSILNTSDSGNYQMPKKSKPQTLEIDYKNNDDQPENKIQSVLDEESVAKESISYSSEKSSKPSVIQKFVKFIITIINSIIGLWIILTGIFLVADGANISGIFCIIGGVIYMPFTRKYIEKDSFHFPRFVPLIILILCILLAAFFVD